MIESTYNFLPYETARLRFRAPRKDDMASAVERVMDPLCVAHLPHLNHKNHTPETSWEWCEFQQKEAEKGAALFVVFERLDDGRVIGDGGYESFWWEDRDGNKIDSQVAQNGDASGLTKYGEIGCMIESSKEVRGKGYGEEIMRGLINMGFGEVDSASEIRRTSRRNFGCDVIRVCMLRDNVAMIGLCSNRLRLKPEYRTTDGVDEVWFKVSREEWRELISHGQK